MIIFIIDCSYLIAIKNIQVDTYSLGDPFKFIPDYDEMDDDIKKELYKVMISETVCYYKAYYYEGDSSKCCVSTKFERDFNTTEFCEVYEKGIYD